MKPTAEAAGEPQPRVRAAHLELDVPAMKPTAEAAGEHHHLDGWTAQADHPAMKPTAEAAGEVQRALRRPYFRAPAMKPTAEAAGERVRSRTCRIR